MTVALAYIRTKCDVDIKLLCFRYLNLVCDNYVNSDVCEILVNYDVTCDLLCWIMYDLGFYVGLFEIPHDFIGLPGLYGFKYDSTIAPVVAIVLVHL